MSKNVNKSLKNHSKPVTILLSTLTILLGALTIYGVNCVSKTKLGAMQVISDAPSLCYDAKDYDSAHIIENAYVCLAYPDENGENMPATSLADYTFFLQNTIMFSREIQFFQLKSLVGFIGALFTLTSGFVTIAYWLHHKS
ncbi:hypothetical protein IJI17_00255 [Candidatus Saccharibacteria bacterium]|nr:hypothetical protein [Candidatus Saccharibacteria bacterium]